MGDVMGMGGTRGAHRRTRGVDTGGYQVTREGHTGGTCGDTGGSQGHGGHLGTGEHRGKREGEHGGAGGHGWDTSPTRNARNVPDKAQGGSSPDTPAPPPAPFRGSQGVPKDGRGRWTPGRTPGTLGSGASGTPQGKWRKKKGNGAKGGRRGRQGRTG